MSKMQAVHALKVRESAQQISMVSLSFAGPAVALRDIFFERFTAMCEQHFVVAKAHFGTVVPDCFLAFGAPVSEAKIDKMLIAIANELSVLIYIPPAVPRSRIPTDGTVPSAVIHAKKHRPSNP